MRSLRNLAAVLASGFISVSHATTSTTDFSDLWSNAAEQGWGANVVQQNDILFVTLFVSNPGNQPVWYVASAVARTTNSGATVNFSGPLYQTTAPYFGATFNPANVSNRQVGTLTFSASQISQALITYNVDTVQVTKQVTRQTWRLEDIGGAYLGAVAGTWAGCGATRNGYQETFVALTVTQSNNSITMREDGAGGTYTCTYSGTYAQDGRMGTITGSSLCSDGINQAFLATEVQGGIQDLTMRFVSSQGSCSFSGRIGGIRRGQ